MKKSIGSSTHSWGDELRPIPTGIVHRLNRYADRAETLCGKRYATAHIDWSPPTSVRRCIICCPL